MPALKQPRAVPSGLSGLINAAQLAADLGVTQATLNGWTRTRGFPKPIRPSSKVTLFYLSEIWAWLAEQPRHEPTTAELGKVLKMRERKFAEQAGVAE